MKNVSDAGQSRKQKNARPEAPLFTDLTPYLDGTATQEVPSVAEMWLGKFLLYSGRLNEIHAEPGTGKTNVLMAAAISVLEAGGTVLYIDPEDTPQGIVARFRLLGADVSFMRARLHYLHNPTPDDIVRAHAWAMENKPELVILDGVAEAMVAGGFDENSAANVLQYFRLQIRPFAEAGAAVVLADHVTKATEGRGQFARGSGAKAGRYDGVSYDVLQGEAYTPTKGGFVTLKIAKDRNGGAGSRGEAVAELHFSPIEGGGTRCEWKPAEGKTAEPFRPTTIMDRIKAHLATCKTANTRELRAHGKGVYVDLAIKLLLEEGEILLETHGQAKNYSLNRSRNAP